MSRAGNVWDRASDGAGGPSPVARSAMESFFSSLKTERVRRKVNETRDQARSDVFDDVERFHDPKRRHSTIGCVGPTEFERRAESARGGVHGTGSRPLCNLLRILRHSA